MHLTPTARVLVALGSWCFARAGIEWHVGQAAGPVAHSLRDKQGRFRPKDGGGYGFPRDVPHKVADLLHEMGVTQQMYECAYTPLVLPADIEDLEALERSLREWISANINHWVTSGKRSIGMVMRALMWTYAISFYKYQPPKKMVAWYMRHVAAGSRADAGADLASSRSEPTLDTRQESNRHDATTPRKDRQAAPVNHWSERFQRVADLEQTEALGHGARAFCPLGEFDHAVAREQDGGITVGEDLASSRFAGFSTLLPSTPKEGTTKNTKEKKATTDDLQREPLRALRDLRVLRGESPHSDKSTTAGGRKVLSYIPDETSSPLGVFELASTSGQNARAP